MKHRLVWLSLAATMLAALGCARGYHRYKGCDVPCAYCVPPPLEYQQPTRCPCFIPLGKAAAEPGYVPE